MAAAKRTPSCLSRCLGEDRYVFRLLEDVAQEMMKDQPKAAAVTGLLRAGVMSLVLCVSGVASVQAQAADGDPMRPGQTFRLSLDDLPAPYSRPAVPRGGDYAPRPAGHMPDVPDGFKVSVFAGGILQPREMAVAPDGTVFVALARDDTVLGLRDIDGDGKADQRVAVAAGFRDPTGLAVHDGSLYVADRRAVWRIALPGEELRPMPRSMVTRPGVLGFGGGHVTREIVFSPDGEHFFVAIGSATNVGEDPHPRATIQQFRIDGNVQTTYASGLRGPVGMSFYPGTDDLYALVSERYGLGGGLVPDFLTRVERDGFYGFPYAYLGNHPDPQFGDLRPDLVKASIAPDLLLEPHTGPMGLLFVEAGDGLPEEWQGDALVAAHGTRSDGGSAGFAVLRVPFRDGRPVGGYEAVMTGFKAKGPKGAIWGRPVWLARAGDGSLLVSDDVANVIWQMRWEGRRAKGLMADQGTSGGVTSTTRVAPMPTGPAKPPFGLAFGGGQMPQNGGVTMPAMSLTSP